MAINFNQLPVEKPSMGDVIPKGNYIALIEKAEMKQGRDETKPPYLSMQLAITDKESNIAMGRVWAIITESEKPLARYQLKRFIDALELPITGDFELKDLTKLVKNKKLRVDIVPEKRDDEQPPQRSVVDALSGSVYYPLEEESVSKLDTEEKDLSTPQTYTEVIPEPLTDIDMEY